MPRYIVLVDGKPGAYGVVFPDAPGCTAMGDTIEQAFSHAREALADWIAHSRKEGFPIPEPRTVDELLMDPEVIEQIAETGAVMREV